MGWWSILKRAPERYTRASTRALSLFLLSLTLACFCGSFALTASRWSESACKIPHTSNVLISDAASQVAGPNHAAVCMCKCTRCRLEACG